MPYTPSALNPYLGPRVGLYSLFYASGALITYNPLYTEKGTPFIPRLLLGLVIEPLQTSRSLPARPVEDRCTTLEAFSGYPC